MYRKRLLMTLLAMGVVILTAYCQTDTIAGKTHDLSGVEVSAHRIPVQVNATKPIQTMEKEELEALGLVNLAEAVKKFAGVNVRDYGGIGGMKTVSVRNLGAHHTGVSYDDITISNTQAGQIDIGRFSLDNVESVSMSIGDNEDLMQTARHYAAAGLLSLKTEKPHFDNGKKEALRLRLMGGSFGMVSPSLLYWHKLGKSTNLSVHGKFMRADGTYPYTLTNVSEKSREKRYNSDIYSWQGEANLYTTLADSSQLDVKAYWFYSQRGLPGSVVLYNALSDERLWDEEFFSQANYKKAFNDKIQLRAHVKYSHSWNRYEDPRTEYNGEMQIDIDRQDEYYGSATLGWKPLQDLEFAFAQDLIYNNLRNNISLYNYEELPYPKRFTSLSVLSMKYQRNRLRMNANVVGTYATEHVETGDSPDDRKRLSPTLSVGYRLTNNEALYLRAMIKHTFRMPTFTDLYYRRSGNPKLNPEKARLYDLGLTWSGQPAKFINYLSVTFDGYYNNVHDKIVAFPTTYIWKMVNYGKVDMWGLDATVSADLPISEKVSAILNATYSYQVAKNMTDPNSQVYKNQLPYTPWHNGNASLAFHTPWLNIAYNLSFCGKRYSMAQNKSEYKLSPYTISDINLTREFQMRRCRLILSGMILNLFDKQYDIIKYYPMPGRSFRLTATLNL